MLVRFSHWPKVSIMSILANLCESRTSNGWNVHSGNSKPHKLRIRRPMDADKCWYIYWHSIFPSNIYRHFYIKDRWQLVHVMSLAVTVTKHPTRYWTLRWEPDINGVEFLNLCCQNRAARPWSSSAPSILLSQKYSTELNIDIDSWLVLREDIWSSCLMLNIDIPFGPQHHPPVEAVYASNIFKLCMLHIKGK